MMSLQLKRSRVSRRAGEALGPESAAGSHNLLAEFFSRDYRHRAGIR
jgi:hypothetical protein